MFRNPWGVRNMRLHYHGGRLMQHGRRKAALCAAAPIGTILLLAAALYGLGHIGLQPPGKRYDSRMAGEIAAQPCWKNTLDTRVPQTDIYEVMARHILEGDEGQEKRRLLFIGLDGALAPAVGILAQRPGSVVAELAAQGGLWLGQAGGAKPRNQVTRTAPGWTSMFTGCWADRHQVYDNGDTLSPEVRTILYQIQARGGQASFSFSWKPHLTASYRLEAGEYPDTFQYCGDDAGTLSSMLRAIDEGKDAVFGIFEHADHAGHITGYSTRIPGYMRAMESAQADVGALVAAARERMDLYGEDWLIIIASDHGGLGFDHRGPTLMESTTFFMSNQVIFV